MTEGKLKARRTRGLHDPVIVGLEDIFEGRKRSRWRVSKKLNSLQFTSVSCQGMDDTTGCTAYSSSDSQIQAITASYGCTNRCICNLTFISIVLPTCLTLFLNTESSTQPLLSFKEDWSSVRNPREREGMASFHQVWNTHTLADRNCKYCLILTRSRFKSARYLAWKTRMLRYSTKLLDEKNKWHLGLLSRKIHHPALFCWDLCWMTSSAS